MKAIPSSMYQSEKKGQFKAHTWSNNRLINDFVTKPNKNVQCDSCYVHSLGWYSYCWPTQVFCQHSNWVEQMRKGKLILQFRRSAWFQKEKVTNLNVYFTSKVRWGYSSELNLVSVKEVITDINSSLEGIPSHCRATPSIKFTGTHL